MLRRGLVALVAPIVVALVAVFWLAANLERFINRVEPVALPAVSEVAKRVHGSSFVVDLHADSLLFGRDLLARGSVGHVDLPRLQDGGVGLQFFTATTKTPLGFNIDRTDGERPDLLTALGALWLSPRWMRGPFERALIQAERFAELSARSGGRLVPVRTVAELDALVARHAADPAVVGGLLGIEGAHALGDSPANVEIMFAAGYRMIGLAHFFDNAFSGSAHGMQKYALTPAGKQLVQRMQELGIVVDLAHASPATIDEILTAARKPVIVSHGGVRGTCDNVRNLSDEQVRGVARTGGVIGIGYWHTAICGTEMRYVTAAMRHVISLVGDEYVGLGSDFDGATTTGFDTSALPALTQQMLNDGFSETSIAKILGGNAVRVLRQTLPAG
jgi:microsomal dipeptidase-like Zn-dependent dipeptidase